LHPRRSKDQLNPLKGGFREDSLSNEIEKTGIWRVTSKKTIKRNQTRYAKEGIYITQT